jgi:hypothetical protein
VTTDGDLPTTRWRQVPWAPLLVGCAGVLTVALAAILLYPATLPVSDQSIPPTPAAARTGLVPGLGAGGPSGSTTASRSSSKSPSPGASKTTKPVTRPGGRPGSANTGAIASIPLATVNGDQTYTAANQVVENVDIRGAVRITGHVTLRNAIVRGNAACGAILQVSGGATVQDVEVVPDHPSTCTDGVYASATTLSRLNVHGVATGVKAGADTTLADSWVHDLAPVAVDAVRTQGARNVTLRHNVLSAGPKANAAYQVTQEGGASGSLRVDANWIDGGNCSLNFAARGGGPTPLTGITVTNNRFGHDTRYVCPILISTQTVLTTNSGNVFDDTGGPIPAVQQHD